MPRKKAPKTIEYNPGLQPQGRPRLPQQTRFVENVSRGLRLVGFADEIVRIDHKGWYIRDDEYDETYRGVVYQLPSHKGETRFAYGYADPDNDDCALLCLDTEETKEDAARAADRFAEIFAEQERDYNRAWQAGRRYEDLADEVKDLRSEALAIGAELREARKLVQNAPTICATLRETVFSLYRRISKTRKERAELLDNYGREPGFQE